MVTRLPRRTMLESGAEEAGRRRSPQGLASFCSAGCRRRGPRPARCRPRRSTGCLPGGRLCTDVCYAARQSESQSTSLEFQSITPSDAAVASCLVFGAFSHHRLGTRQIEIQDQKFYGFSFPHSNTVQVVVWRQLGDVIGAGYRLPDQRAACRVCLLSASESLSPGRSKEGPLVDAYSGRAFDRTSWVYWESFWAPVGTAAIAARAGRVHFQPLLSPEMLRVGQQDGSQPQLPRNPWEGCGPDVSQAAPTTDFKDTRSKVDAFEHIYRKDVWPGLVSKSGPGSDPFHPMVRLAITALDAAVDALGITSILDAACGDAGWITSHFLARRPEISYIGIDIVPHVIEENRQRHPSLRFLVADLGDPAEQAELPRVDLVFSKETLNHMFVQEAVHALCRLRSTGAKYLVANIARGAPNNRGARKLTHANYYPYDYSLPPFNLRKLAKLADINFDDWTEFSIFQLQP